MTESTNSNKPWIIQGIFWGFFMFIFNTILLPLGNGEPIILKNILIGIITWTIGGLLFGYTMKLISKRTEKTSSQKES